MKKLAIAITLCIVAITSHLYYVFSLIDGVDVHEMAISMQSPAEKYNYHKKLKSLIYDKNPDSLHYLINANCGGGTGCYEHGKTLVQVLIKIGDRHFSKMISTLPTEDFDLLLNLLSAGHEYGGFTAFPEWNGFKNDFPLTFRALNANT